jgi:Fe2+ or Zn2+ uptake regulation protein
MKCPKCRLVIEYAEATYSEPDKEISAVHAICKRCGEVEPDDWCWEDFFLEDLISDHQRESVK